MRELLRIGCRMLRVRVPSGPQGSVAQSVERRKRTLSNILFHIDPVRPWQTGFTPPPYLPPCRSHDAWFGFRGGAL